MRLRLSTLLDYLRAARTETKPRRVSRLSIEVLEERCTPVVGSVTGQVYLNTPTNPLLGATISLQGTPTAAPIIPVNLTAVTDASGTFTFSGLPAGNYTIATGPFAGLLGTVTIGGVTSSAGVNISGPATIGTASKVVLTGGLAPQFISLTQFLNTSSPFDFPFGGAAGAGAPNNAPFVSTPIGTQTLTATTPTKVIDLAGHFSDPTFTNSSVTLNITANGVANQKINLTLLDTATPQTVANFFNYINSGAYNNSFFHRKTTVATDGIAVLQGGGAIITDGVGPSVITPVLPAIPDELGVSNLKGTLAMANTGGDNTATDQFFFNTADNTTLNPNFTVFARVADDASQAVLDSLAATPSVDLSNHTATIAATGATESGNTVTITTTTAHQFTVGRPVTISGVGVAGYNGTFTIDSVPTTTTFTYTNPTTGLGTSGGGTATVSTAFATASPTLLLNSVPLTGGSAIDFPTDASRYVVINSVTTTKRDDFLTYSIVSNTNPAAATAALTNEQLTITRVAAGTTVITVQATDRFGNSATLAFTVTVT